MSLLFATDQPILRTPSTKNLAFIFSSTLSSSKHFRYLILPYSRRLSYSSSYRLYSCLHHLYLSCSLIQLMQHALSFTPVTQIKNVQQIQNALVGAVTRTLEHSFITPALKELHWLKVEKYAIVSITHNRVNKSEQAYLRNLIEIKPTSKTRTSDHSVYLPSITSDLKLYDRRFCNSS